jgi:8-oxo-dGTP diphosphatase
MEECGNDLIINSMKFFHAVDAYYKDEGKHYTTIFMRCQCAYGQAKNMEPDKSEGWDWYNVDKLPEPLMLSIKLLLQEKEL